MIYSYDVFDTIITRKTATPHGIFALMQEKIMNNSRYNALPKDVKRNFFELRIQAERLARYNYCTNGREDVSIEDIYSAMNTMGMLEDDDITMLIKCEYETELENVVGIRNVIEEIIVRMRNGERVVLISDMYMSKEMIQSLLEKADKRMHNLPLYVSSEEGKTKSSGNLFQLVSEKENVSYKEWHHTGDNSVSDILVPKRLGIETRHIHKSILTKMEKQLIGSDEGNTSFQILIGIGKNTRLLNELSFSGTVGSSLGGILLVSYVRWILNDARKKDTHTLYFIARDGYVLKLIADIFIARYDLPIETKYIYGSRKAWRMPAQVTKDMDILQMLQASTPEFVTSLSKVAEIFGITDYDLAKYLPNTLADGKEKLSRIDVDVLFYYLDSCEAFEDYIVNSNVKKRELVKEYFLQELNEKEESWNFVEVGGTGYTQKCLENILKDVSNKDISTYFFQLYSVSRNEKSTFFNFIPDGLYIKDAIEPLCRAPHGQTLRYEMREEKVEPVLEYDEENGLEQCDYGGYINGLIAYVNTLGEFYNDIFEEPVDRKLIEKCWDYYTHIMDEEILDFVGEVPFEVVGNNMSYATYAPKLTHEDIENIFNIHYKEPSSWYYKGASLNMSVLRATQKDKEYIQLLKEKHRKLVHSEETPKIETSLFAKIPSGRYRSGSKVVIYGAGNLGKAFAYGIEEKSDYEMVLWVDRQYMRFQKEGILVEDPRKILNTTYDKIVIAVLNERIAKQIRNDLIAIGIEEEYIDWISPRELIYGGIHERTY